MPHCPPSFHHFLDPLLRQLGKATQCKANVFIKNSEILPAVIRDAGFDPDNLASHGDPKEGWRRQGQSSPEGFDRRVWAAFKSLYYNCDDPLTVCGPIRGEWGLTKQGARKALQMFAPSPALFHVPIIKAMGHASKLSTTALHFRDIVPEIFSLMGYDPCQLPEGWDIPANNGMRLGSERVRWGFKNLSDRCLPLVTKAGRGKWSLTEAGIEEAHLINGTRPRNLTCEYLDQRFKETGGQKGTLMQRMIGTVTAKLPLSAASGRVEDHIQNCLMRLIQRDALRERILEGRRIPDSLLATYAVRAGYNDIRSDGTDPVAREMYGARTETERAKGLEVLTPMVDSRLVWERGEDGSFAPMDIASAPLDSVAEVEDWLQFEGFMDQVEQIVRTRKPKTWRRYIGVIRMRASGFTFKEIAQEEGLTPHKAAIIVTEAKKCFVAAQESTRVILRN